jgi:hypothetical protein
MKKIKLIVIYNRDRSEAYMAGITSILIIENFPYQISLVF